MADNTDEEQLDLPINNQSENPPDEIPPTVDTNAINRNQETKNMEVHHHPKVEQKNFKEYLLEFIMILRDKLVLITLVFADLLPVTSDSECQSVLLLFLRRQRP